jgi:hypothetical protein
MMPLSHAPGLHAVCKRARSHFFSISIASTDNLKRGMKPRDLKDAIASCPIGARTRILDTQQGEIMRRFTKPNLTLVLALIVSGATLSTTASADLKSNRMRVDCRFYSSSQKFCYTSAMYKVYNNGEIDDVHYGIGCNYETMYDDGATTEPQDELSDTIRPGRAALPRVEITPKGSLRHPGTYSSKLETDHGRFNDGTCYVREIDEDEADYHLMMQNLFFLQ